MRRGHGTGPVYPLVDRRPTHPTEMPPILHTNQSVAAALDMASSDERRFTPDQAARVLHRAIALESDRIHRVSDEMSLRELIDLGEEVGLTEWDVRTAAALEPWDARPERGGALLRAAGAHAAREQRVVDGDHHRVGRLVDEWVRVAHCMRVHSRDESTVRWEPAAGIVGSVRRGARQMAGETVIDGLRGITTRVTPIGDGRCAVAVEFDPGSRERSVAQAIVAGGGLAVAGTVGGILATGLAFLAVPLGVVLAGGVLASRRRTLVASEREITRMMSAVAADERPPRALDAVRGRMRARVHSR